MPDEKKQFMNKTGGWIGVTVLDARGQERGAAVEPNGTVWLSEIEMQLTANKPRKPADNPFIPQTRIRTHPETGVSEEYTVTPLVPFNEDRYVPSADQRFVPDFNSSDARIPIQEGIVHREPPLGAVATIPGARVVAEAAEQELPPGAMPPAQQQPKPPSRAAAAVAATQEDTVDEEHAVKVDPDIEEETGAAKEPQGPPVEGEYAMQEEVGTPDAPRAPYVPPEE